MPGRLDYNVVAPDGLRAMRALDQYVRKSGLEPGLVELVKLRASLMNGCAYCVNSHTAALVKLGVDQETLGEVLAIAGLFNMTNALADGYQVEPDVLPPL